MRTTQYYNAEELPEPEILTMREMLDEMEEVNVLGRSIHMSSLPDYNLIEMSHTRYSSSCAMLQA